MRVTTPFFPELFASSDLPLAIDSYQRAYVWNEEKIVALIEDLEGYAASGVSPQRDYYMGTVLLHENRAEGKRFIIDGQQRITSLCILHRAVTGNLPENLRASSTACHRWACVGGA